MPICTEWLCGTGRDDITLPGDPGNNSLLSVKPIYGGNQIDWTYPDTNPHGIAYIRVFRGVTGVFASAGLLAIVSANNYFDRIDAEFIKEYFYWIQVVSVNGTELPPIGPVSGTPLPEIGRLIEFLTGRIEAGMLAPALRVEVDRITANANALDSEINARTLRDMVVADALQVLQNANAKAMTTIADETVNRRAANEALLNHVNVLAAGLDDAQAALLNEEQVRATQDTALAGQIAQAEARVGEQVAAVQTNLSAQVDATNNTVGALWTARLTANGLIGGFGIINDGTSVEAGFDVDKFWIGRTNLAGAKPFIIENDTVYLNKVLIKSSTIGSSMIIDGSVINEKIGNIIQSENYVPSVSGWNINKAGTAEFQNALVRGTVYATSGSFDGTISAKSVEAALGNATYYNFTTAGPGSFTIPAGLDCDTIRIAVTGGSGGGGGGGGAAIASDSMFGQLVVGGRGGNGGNGSTVIYDIPYAGNAGRTFTFTVGGAGAGGSGGRGRTMNEGSGAGGTGTAGGAGGVSSVSGIGSAAGGAGGGGGGSVGTYAPVAVNGSTGGDGGGGAGGTGGTWYEQKTSDPGKPGAVGRDGAVRFGIFKGNAVVRTTTYQNLITWLDTLGHGAVPSNARA